MLTYLSLMHIVSITHALNPLVRLSWRRRYCACRLCHRVTVSLQLGLVCAPWGSGAVGVSANRSAGTFCCTWAPLRRCGTAASAAAARAGGEQERAGRAERHLAGGDQQLDTPGLLKVGLLFSGDRTGIKCVPVAPNLRVLEGAGGASAGRAPRWAALGRTRLPWGGGSHSGWKHVEKRSIFLVRLLYYCV